MVNTWLPDPPQEHALNNVNIVNEQNEETGDRSINTIFDEIVTEEDNNQYEGYQPLPVDPADSIDQDDSSDEDTIEEEPSKPSTSSTLPPIVPIERILVKEVWSSPTPHDIEMDAEKENEVKLAMMNFTLPDSSIPEWAANIPEDQWKQTLIDKIQSKYVSNDK